jgi:hypothetical protein
MKAVRISVDGDVELVDWETLEDMYHILDVKWVEFYHIQNANDAIVIDDEGAINGSLLNPLATFLATALGSPSLLFGDVMVIGVDGPDEIDVSPAMVDLIESMLKLYTTGALFSDKETQ